MIKKKTNPSRIVKKSAKQVTLGIVKPDAMSRHAMGDIIAMVEKSGLVIRKIKIDKLSKSRAAEFYAVHKERPFFKQLVNFMTSGEIAVFAAEGDDAVSHYRKLIGDTDPKKAAAGTIRRKFGTDREKNAVHGSDSQANALKEVRFFFSQKK